MFRSGIAGSSGITPPVGSGSVYDKGKHHFPVESSIRWGTMPVQTGLVEGYAMRKYSLLALSGTVATFMDCVLLLHDSDIWKTENMLFLLDTDVLHYRQKVEVIVIRWGFVYRSC